MVFNFFKKKKKIAQAPEPRKEEMNGAGSLDETPATEAADVGGPAGVTSGDEAQASFEEAPEAAAADEGAPEAQAADDETPETAPADDEAPEAATADDEAPEAATADDETPEAATADDEAPEASTPADGIATDNPGKEGGGFFKRLKKGLSKTREILNTDVDKLFTGRTIVDDDLLEDLEELLITSDLGVRTSMEIIERIGEKSSKIKNAGDLKRALKEEITALIDFKDPIAEKAPAKPHVIMVIGVNGVGKTTTIGKIAAKLSSQGKKVLIIAADTFRAAAVEQLVIWAERAGTDIVKHKENSDPAAVTFDGIEASVARGMDVVLIDTAGRLHNKKNLMEELKKIKRTAGRKLHGAPHETLLVVDATTGQNALTQAQMFNQEIGIDSLALTKLDGTAKGGIVVSITSSLQLPLKYIGVGEQVDDLQEFDPARFVDAML